MDQLNKTQIVLLTLLTSFVTAIATGIITVALMEDQVPVGVTQTVNRVVERTIEKVVPEKGQSAGVITKEVVVKEENLVTDSIAKVSENIVRIKNPVATSDGTVIVTAAIGLLLDKEGMVVTDAKAVNPYGKYTAINSAGEEIPMKYVSSEGGLAFLRPENPTKIIFVPAKLGDSEAVKIGQTAITIYGNERNIVSLGIISAGRRDAAGKYESFDSNLGGENIYGSPVFNLRGEIIGIRLPGETGTYITSSNTVSLSLDKVLSI